MTDDVVRTCVTCAHHRRVYVGGLREVSGCDRSECGSGIDPVDGKRFYAICSEARRGERACGLEGRLWEPAEQSATGKVQ